MNFSKATSTRIVEGAYSVYAAQRDPDFVLVERVQAGDATAFDDLIRKYRERLYSVVYNMTSNHEDAADITQEAFIKAFSSINSFKKSSIFFTWLYRIAMNTTFSFLKKARGRRFFSLDSLREENAGDEISWLDELVEKKKTDKALLLKELQEKLNEALQRLSPDHRMVIVLYEIEGVPQQQISEIMGTSEGTVRSRLHYARSQLKSYLQEYIS